MYRGGSKRGSLSFHGHPPPTIPPASPACVGPLRSWGRPSRAYGTRSDLCISVLRAFLGRLPRAAFMLGQPVMFSRPDPSSCPDLSYLPDLALLPNHSFLPVSAVMPDNPFVRPSSCPSVISSTTPPNRTRAPSFFLVHAIRQLRNE
jgi:hypothetical protein